MDRRTRVGEIDSVAEDLFLRTSPNAEEKILRHSRRPSRRSKKLDALLKATAPGRDFVIRESSD
jgi:hypothetical protein